MKLIKFKLKLLVNLKLSTTFKRQHQTLTVLEVEQQKNEASSWLDLWMGLCVGITFEIFYFFTIIIFLNAFFNLYVTKHKSTYDCRLETIFFNRKTSTCILHNRQML